MAPEGTGEPPAPLLTIPVVVHVVYYNGSPADNLSAAVVQSQIDELNAGFRTQPTSAAALQVPTSFRSLVADARVNFCLATRDPAGNITTGTTSTSTTATSFSHTSQDMKFSATGGKDAWNTTQYLNIWCCRITDPNILGFAHYPGSAPSGSYDGVVVTTQAFGGGPHAPAPYNFGRVAVHEVGHWLNLKHLWGDTNVACASDDVPDTPTQAGPNFGSPTSPIVTCSNGPNGDMYMNHMDYVNDDTKLMFSRDQALRMQAAFAPGGPRAGLRSSPAFNPVLSITTSTMPAVLSCGDQTDYNFRPASNSVGCGGGYISHRWTATNGWAVNYPDSFYPEIIPNGTTGSTITLTGTYTNAAGVNLPLNPVSRTVSVQTQFAAPVFTSGNPTMACAGRASTFSVAPFTAPGVTGYVWVVPAGFTAPGLTIVNGQVATTVPNVSIAANAALAAGIYAVQCRLQTSSGCAALASYSFGTNGGSDFIIRDSRAYLTQNVSGVVCQKNNIYLTLEPVSPGTGATADGIAWTATGGTLVLNAAFPNQAVLKSALAGGVRFTVNATYKDACGVAMRNAISYSAITASGPTELSNGYDCSPNRWFRSVPPAPYPNPAAGTLQLPGYRGQVTVYNQHGKLVCSLMAPGTEYGATVNVGAWPEGLYVVTGRGLNGEPVRHNVQIQH